MATGDECGDVRTLRYKTEDSLAMAYYDFVDRVRTRRLTLSNLSLGMKVVQILEKADASLGLKGAHVRFSPSSGEEASRSRRGRRLGARGTVAEGLRSVLLGDAGSL